MTLNLDDFPAIFGAVHRQPRQDGTVGDVTRTAPLPFAWQLRLLQRVVEVGWPATLDAPTSSGKTAVLDIALFHLALSAGGAPCAPAPRRIVFAVDRRVIVDQAFNRARRLCMALETSTDERVTAMAEALRTLAGGDSPLHVEMLRGGMPREDEWARSPIQPTILCTTVDQLGSRLLFRGYGVSPSMAPIHAGLLGEDALLLLDEAHLSKPFQQTLERIAERRGSCVESPRPWAVCSLTATPQDARGDVFRLSDEERGEPAIATRLTAAKTAELELCKDAAQSPGHAAALLNAAIELSGRCSRPAPTVAIIVNRVALARSVLQALSEGGYDAILLTGRVRPVERSSLLDKYEARLTSQGGATESQAIAELPSRPLFVVATQCIEAGADFDFDAMVTQIAPLDALRQRFGRLNRLGLRDQAPAVVIAARSETARGSDDPLYQGTLRETWEFLSAHAGSSAAKGRPALGINPLALEALVTGNPEAAGKCLVRMKDAPVLRAADVAFLAMTNPRPHPDPYLPLYLHGEPTSDADVSIVWRADCEIIASRPEGASNARVGQVATAIVACQPPKPGEALRVPIWAAKAWLAQRSREAANVADAEGERDPNPNDGAAGGRLALLWRGPDHADTALIRADGLRPGDLIVVPASYGGCDQFGWSPTSADATDDLADEAGQPYRTRFFAIRLHPALWQGEQARAWAEAWQQLYDHAAEDGATGLGTALREMSGLPPVVKKAVDLLPANLRQLGLRIEFPYDLDQERPSGAVLIAPHGIAPADGSTGRSAASTEDDTSGCFADGSVSLARHTDDVVEQAEKFAGSLGLGRRLGATIAFAARYHDAGKADPRFQRWLAGLEHPRELLAKSGQWRAHTAEHLARIEAGLPPQWRHEVLSVRIALQHLAAAEDIDPALALYLVGTHHGHGRPFFPHHDPWDMHAHAVMDTPVDAGPGPDRLDFDWQGRDWTELVSGLQAQYGVWGLAFLEAVLRLADHRASERRA